MEEIQRRGCILISFTLNLSHQHAFQFSTSCQTFLNPPVLQSSWPPPSAPPISNFLPKSIFALLRGAQWAGPPSQLDALRLILAIAAATSAAPLAGPQRF